jgi:protein-S-isoprenylcysteine O-methyltransferase
MPLDWRAMSLPLPALLGIAYGLSEAGLGWLKRSRDDSVDADDRSLRSLWITILLSVAAGVFAAYRLPQAGFGGIATQWIGCTVFGLGLALRWYSIVYLGRYFTVNIAIHSSHEVIDTGPYRRIRHPSYAGALLAFLGLGLTLGNWVSLALVTLPIFWAFKRRIRKEERALANALGTPYTRYMWRTKRLLPFVY